MVQKRVLGDSQETWILPSIDPVTLSKHLALGGLGLVSSKTRELESVFSKVFFDSSFWDSDWK